MNLRVSERTPGDWDKGLVALGGSIFHSTGWGQYQVAVDRNVNLRYLTLVSDEGEALGMALAFDCRSDRAVVGRLNWILRLDALPVVRGNDMRLTDEFLSQLEAHARDSGHVELFVNSYGYCGRSGALERLGYRMTKRLEFELSLECPEQELWEGMEPQKRNKIRKAERLGVAVEELSIQEGVCHLRQLQVESSRRIVNRGGPDITYQGSEESDPVRVLLKAGLGRIIGARVNGSIVSAALFTRFNGLVYYTLSGHNQKALETQAPTLVVWEMVKRHRYEGAKRFNLGGCRLDALNEGSPEHGVYAYKKAFGAKCLECANGHKVLRESLYRVGSAVRLLLKRR